MRFLISFLLACSCAPIVSAEETTPAPKRAPAGIMTYMGAAWLERPERVDEEQPDKVIAAMELKPGQMVADIGVGTGFFARRMAKLVAPEGVVYGVEIQPEMLEFLKDYCSRDKIENVKPVLGAENSSHLPDASVDWILLVDTYHEFQDAPAMLADMHRALKPGGKVALIEYRLLGDTAKHIKEEHRMSVKQVLAEWQPAGFELVDLLEFLPAQHYFIFRKKVE